MGVLVVVVRLTVELLREFVRQFLEGGDLVAKKGKGGKGKGKGC